MQNTENAKYIGKFFSYFLLSLKGILEQNGRLGGPSLFTPHSNNLADIHRQ